MKMKPDKIIIRDLRLHGIIGAYPHERNQPQDIILNIEVETDIRSAAQADDYRLSIDYAKLIEDISAHFATRKALTVEAFASEIADICLTPPEAKAVTVRLEKPEAIINTAGVGVEIYRTK